MPAARKLSCSTLIGTMVRHDAGTCRHQAMWNFDEFNGFYWILICSVLTWGLLIDTNVKRMGFKPKHRREITGNGILSAWGFMCQGGFGFNETMAEIPRLSDPCSEFAAEFD